VDRGHAPAPPRERPVAERGVKPRAEQRDGTLRVGMGASGNGAWSGGISARHGPGCSERAAAQGWTGGPSTGDRGPCGSRGHSVGTRWWPGRTHRSRGNGWRAQRRAAGDAHGGCPRGGTGAVSQRGGRGGSRKGRRPFRRAAMGSVPGARRSRRGRKPSGSWGRATAGWSTWT
jgi:hypothetical protein